MFYMKTIVQKINFKAYSEMEIETTWSSGYF